MKLLVTEHKSKGELRSSLVGNCVRVFINNDLSYGFFVDEHFLFELLDPAAQQQYLANDDVTLEVTPETAQKLIDAGTTPYLKPRVV